MAEQTNSQQAPSGPKQGQASSQPGPARTGVAKREAVRRALIELGQDATPTDIQKFVKKRFHIDMSKDHISTSKGEIRRQEAKKEEAAAQKPAAKPAAKEAAPQPQLTPASKGKPSGISLQDILTVKELVERHGAEPIRTLVDAFAR